MAIKQITSAPSISPEGKSIAKIREIRGKSLVWNQLFAAINAENYTAAGKVTISDGALVYTGTGSGYYQQVNLANSKRFDVIAGHKYLLSFDVPVNTITSNTLEFFGFGTAINAILGFIMLGNTTGHKSDIITVNSSATVVCVGFSSSAGAPVAEGETASVKNIQLIDLTLMFGAGNEPETVEEFEAMFPENYYEYNSGEIINSNINAIEAVGFNQWDEEWELGTYNTTTGEKSDTAGYIRSVNVIKVLPDVNYYIKKPASFATRVLQYDSLGNYLGYLSPASAGSGDILSFVENTAYIKFHIYLTTYNHDICINLSDTSRNGTYEPYKKSTLPLNISTLTGKLNREGESVVICSDGLKSAGSVYDYGIVEDGYLTKIVKVIGEVDLGDLTWEKDTQNRMRSAGISSLVKIPDGTNKLPNVVCEKYLSDTSGNTYNNTNDKRISIDSSGRIAIYDSAYTASATFKTAMAGVKLYYELAAPQTYVLDTPILIEYNTDGGTEQIVFSENLLSTPLVADIDYFNNAIKHIQFNEEKHCVRDERITGIDYIPIEQSTNVITSAGVYNAISEAKAPLQSVSYKSAWLSTSAHTVHFLMNVKPVDWEKVYTVKYRLNCSIENTTSSNTESLVTLQFTKDVLRAYYVENAVTSTSYKSFYQHYVYPVSDVGFNSGFGSGVGIYIHQSTASYSYAGSSRYRLIDVDLLEAINCEVELFSEDLDAEDMQLDTSTTHGDGVAISSATGLQETGDANTTDTKNTAGSTDTSNKIFLIGATSQDTNPQTYSDNEVYATSGVLTTKSVQVGGTSATMQYNSTDQSIEFVFS